jgi:hypothetical protein
MHASAVGYTLTYFTTLKQQLVTWTVVDLITTKFKPSCIPQDMESKRMLNKWSMPSVYNEDAAVSQWVLKAPRAVRP